MSPCRIWAETNGICCSVMLSLKWPLSLNNSLSSHVTFQYSQALACPAGFPIVRQQPVQNVNAFGALTCCPGCNLTLTWPMALCWATCSLRDGKISAILFCFKHVWFYNTDDYVSLRSRNKHHTAIVSIFSPKGTNHNLMILMKTGQWWGGEGAHIPGMYVHECTAGIKKNCL